MIVSCPECGARYRLAENAIPPEGRAMRCASCKHRWFELGPEPEEPPAREPLVLTPEPVDMPAPSPDTAASPDVVRTVGVIDHRHESPPPDADDEEELAPRGHPVLKTILAIILGAAFSAAAAAMWIPASQLPQLDLSQVPWLEALVDPPKAPPSPLTLSFTADPQPVSGGRTLYALTGTLTNPTDTAQTVPPLQGRLVDASGTIAYRWTIPAPAGVLLPGQQVPFDASALGDANERVVIAH